MFFVPAILLTFVVIMLVLLPLAKGRAGLAGEKMDAKILFRRRSAALAALVFIPVFSITVYSALGRPDLPDMPLASRKESSLEKADFSALILRLETHLQQEPGDAQGWQLLAQNYRLAGRSSDAVKVYEKVLLLKGETVEALLDLGEAILEAGQGEIDAKAEHVFVKVLKKDGTNLEARFFLSRFKSQKNDRAGALKDLKALLTETKDEDVWHRIIEAEIARLQSNAINQPAQVLK